MDGTISNINVKSGHENDLLESMGEMNQEGILAWFLMRPDDKNADLVGEAVFESKEAYISNANSPEQHEAFVKMMEYLVVEPTWTDGEYIAGEMV